jgi:hypothetical protein
MATRGSRAVATLLYAHSSHKHQVIIAQFAQEIDAIRVVLVALTFSCQSGCKTATDGSAECDGCNARCYTNLDCYEVMDKFLSKNKHMFD